MTWVNIKTVQHKDGPRYVVESPQGTYRLDDREALMATLDYLLPPKDKTK